MHFFTFAFDAHPILGNGPTGRQKNGSIIDFDYTNHATGRRLIAFHKTHGRNLNSELPGGVKNCRAVWNFYFYFTIVYG